jgi:prephenate dehydrogenase
MSDDPGFFTRARVAILGLGLMGGSLALALRGQCRELIGIDPDAETIALAARLNLADRLDTSPARLLPEADLVVLAAPVRTILRLLGELGDLHPGAPVVMDLGSTKAEIMRAMNALPARFDPIGAHPMCGKERTSLAQAEAGLYRGAPFALVPLARSGPRARATAEQLVRAAGANPLWLDESAHDRWVAATSHLPYLVSSALAAATPPESAPMVGPGFRSTTRLAAQPPALMLDILDTNRGNILAALGRFRGRLDLLERLLEQGDLAGLQEALADGAACREGILNT